MNLLKAILRPLSGRAAEPAPSTRTVEEAFAEASVHHVAGRLPEAERLYREVLGRDRAHADASILVVLPPRVWPMASGEAPKPHRCTLHAVLSTSSVSGQSPSGDTACKARDPSQ